MTLTIVEEPPTRLAEYAQVPMGFTVAERGARRLRVETQDVNVPACRLYHAQGFRLERATPGAYAELPNEVQLLWHKPLR